MKANRIIEKLQENWLAKVVCFVMALFFYFFYLFSMMDRKSFSVPLEIDAQNGMVAASSFPANVKVTVRGKPENISTLHENDFYAYLDLNYIAKDGSAHLPVQITLSKNAMLIDPMEIKVSPEEVTLTVEESISAYVPVNPLYSGEPARGYELKTVTVSPQEVRVTGPRTMVENCKRLQTRMVLLTGIKNDTTVTVQLDSPGKFLRVDDDVNVSVTASVTQKTMIKRFESAPVNLSGLNAAFEPSGSVPSVLLSLRGPVLTLENYTPRLSTILANCKGITEEGTHEVPLEFSLPAGTVALDETPKKIKVSIKRKPVEEDSIPEVDKTGEDE